MATQQYLSVEWKCNIWLVREIFLKQVLIQSCHGSAQSAVSAVLKARESGLQRYKIFRI